MMEAPGGGEAVAIEPAQGLAPGVALRGMPSAVANAVFASAARRKGEGGARSELTERELAVLALVFIIFVTVEHAMLLAKQIVEDSVPDAEAYVMTLEERFRESASKLFLEIAEDDDDDLEEVAEAVDLTVHSNAFRFGSQVPSQNGDALGGKIQGARLVV